MASVESEGEGGGGDPTNGRANGAGDEAENGCRRRSRRSCAQIKTYLEDPDDHDLIEEYLSEDFLSGPEEKKANANSKNGAKDDDDEKDDSDDEDGGDEEDPDDAKEDSDEELQNGGKSALVKKFLYI